MSPYCCSMEQAHFSRSYNSCNNVQTSQKNCLIAAELNCYNTDIAALRKTRLADKDSITEVSKGYTFFWHGLPKEDQ